MNRVFAIAVVSGIAAGCADPSISVDVELPAALKSSITSVELHIYVPPSGGFGCLDLELGRVDAGARALSEAQVVRLSGRDSAPIRGLDRLARNVLFVEALDAAGAPVAYACTEVEEFAADVELALAASPAAHLVLPAGLDLSRFAGEALQPRIPVKMLDALQQPVAGARVSWSVATAAETSAPIEVITDAAGAAELAPSLPTVELGPFVLAVRGSWLSSGPVEVRALVAPAPKMGTLPGLPLGAEVGRFREGHDSVIVLFGFGADRRVEFYDAGAFRAMGAAVVASETIRVGGDAMLAKLDYPGEELDRFATISTPGTSLTFTRYDPDAGSVQKTTTRPAGAGAIRKILNSGACRSPGRPMLTIIFEGDVVGEYDEQGNLLSERRAAREDLDYQSSGCIGDETGTARRVLVKRSPFGTSNLEIAGISGGDRSASWLDQPGFLSFSPPIGGPEVLLANTIQSSARAVVQGRLRLDGVEGARIEVLEADPVEEVPVQSAGADLDADGAMDLFTVVTNDHTEVGPRSYRLRVSMSQTYLGRRISGSISIGDDLCYLAMLAGDFDGDGTDDVIASELTPLGCGSLASSRVYLYPMGSP